MAKTISAQAHISYYKAGQLGTPHKTVTIPEIYEQIKTDTALRDRSYSIIDNHRKGIEDGFNTIPKASYQAQKKQYLDAVCFTGNIDRSAGQKPSFQHTERLNLDLDENTKQELQLFRRLVKNGHFPYFEALGVSISGLINGHSWANCLIEIPEEIQGDYDQQEKLHKRYYTAISHALSDIILVTLDCTDRFRKDQYVIRLSAEELRFLGITNGHRLSIKTGKANDLKRVRYLSFDPTLIVREEAKTLTLKELEGWEAYMKQKSKVNYLGRKLDKIIATDTFGYCHEYTVSKGFDYVDGQKQEYLSRFAICANMLGVPEDVTRTYILSNIHPKEDGDFIRYPYKQYKDSFGIWEHRVKVAQDAFKPMDVEASTFLTFDKYLSDSPDFPKLLDRVCQLKKSLLIVPTGTGKTTSAVLQMHDRFKAQYPDKVFIFVSPLTAITRQTGLKKDIQHKQLQIICEGELSFRSALFQDSICTVKSFIDWCEVLHEEDQLKDVILVFDEAHELITGAGYQNFVELPTVFDEVFKVIGLTATPLTPLVSHYGFTPLKCERRTAPAVNIVYKRTTQDALHKTVTAYGNAHRTAKTLYFYNDKEALEELSGILNDKGMKADFYHADIKGKSDTFDTLLKTQHLPEGTDHLFSTKILGFGTSIKGLDGIVYITRRNSKDFLEFVQAYARLREDTINVTVIIIEPKTNGKRKQGNYDFHPAQYEAKLFALQKIADSWNAHELHRIQYDTGNSYKNTVPTEERQYIKKSKLNGNRRYVDTLKIWNEQYQRTTQLITGDDFIRFFKLIPNVTVTEDTSTDFVTYEDQTTIDRIIQEREETKEADTEALKVLITEQKDELFKYIEDQTEDLRLKKRLTEHPHLTPDKLTSEQEELVTRRFKLTEKVVNRYLSLTSDYKDRFDTAQLIEYCFMQNRPFGRLRRQLNSLDNVQLHEAGRSKGAEYGSDTGMTDKARTEAHLQMIQYFEQYAGQTVSGLSDQLKNKDWYHVLKLNNRTWSEEVGFFFDIKRIRTKAERKLYVGDRIMLSSLFGDDIKTSTSLKKTQSNVVTHPERIAI